MKTVLVSILVVDAVTCQATRQETIEVVEMPDELAGRMVGSIERLAQLMREYDKPPEGGSEARVAVSDGDETLECCNVSGHHSRCKAFDRQFE